MRNPLTFLTDKIATSIQWRLVVFTVVPVIGIVVILMSVAISYFIARSEQEIRETQYSQFLRTGERLSLQLNDMELLAVRIADFLSGQVIARPEVIYQLVTTNVSADTLVFGSAIAFESGSFPGREGLFAPFAFRENDRIATLDIGEITSASGYQYDSGEHPWYSAPMQTGEALWTAPYFDAGASNVLMSTYSVPFYRNEQFAGVATIDIALESVFRTLQLVSDTEYVITPNGDYIYHPDSTQILNGILSDMSSLYPETEVNRVIAAIDNNARDVLEVFDREGRDFWVMYYQLPENDWLYLKFVDAGEVMAGVYQQWAFVILIAVVSILVLVVLIWFIAGTITRPISILHQVTESVSNGDPFDEVFLGGKDEISRLGNMLNKMFQVVTRKSDELEQQVAERTGALEKAQSESMTQRDLIEATLNGVSTGIIMYSSELEILACNRKFFDLSGLPERDWRDKTFLDLKIEMYRTVIKKDYDVEVVRKRMLLAEEYTFTIDLPDERVIEVKHAPMRGRDGFIRTFEDVTQREKHQSQLQSRIDELADARLASLNMMRDAEAARKQIHESQQLLEGFVENSGAVIFAKDAEGRYLLVNKEWENVVGQKRDDVIGRTDAEFMEESIAEQFMENDRNVMQEKHVQRTYETPDDERTFLSLKFPLYDINGEVNGIAGISTDVTEQKALEQKLAEERERLDLALRGGNLGFYEYDVASGQVSLSNMYREILGYLNFAEGEEAHIDIREWAELIHPDEQAMANASLQRYIAGKDIEYRVEYRVRAADETWRWILVVGRSDTERTAGSVGRMLGVMIDITDLKHLEAELRVAKDAAESAAAAKANFLASMSHEIRTPMNAVIGMVDLLRQTDVSDDQAHMLQTVSDSGQSLLTIINDILDFSKIEAGRLELEQIPLQLADLVEGAAQTVAVNSRAKGLRLLTYIDPSLPQFVYGDQVRIRQILINLMGNAIKFTDRGSVQVTVQQLTRDDETITLKMSVRDSGIGISEEAQKVLFTVFMQAESSTTRKYGGTGLGLSICERLTSMMNGRIYVESEEGVGSTFHVELPLRISTKQVKEKASDLKGINVLLIIDEEFERRALTAYLEYWHASVRVCGSLAECIPFCIEQKQKESPVDVVVMGPSMDRGQMFSMKNIADDAGLNEIRFLALLQGKRTKARLKDDELVTIDVDPVSRSGFITAISICVGRASPEVHYHDEVESFATGQPRLSVKDAAAAGRLLLVAEDNATNRDVIGRQLKLLGYTFEMVEDGKQAFAAWQSGKYALLLTDCHMPEMDGFELTDAIRGVEKAIDSRVDSERFPIVAITANALQGEAERCLAAGMDGYLAKPVVLRELDKMIKCWLPAIEDPVATQSQSVEQTVDNTNDEMRPSEMAGPELATNATGQNDSSSQKAQEDVVDLTTLNELLAGDEEMIAEVLQDFLEPSETIVDEIYSAVREKSCEGVQQAAHKLKSAARSIGANALADLSFVLETAGKNSELDVINQEVTNLKPLFEAVCDYINQR